MKSANTAPAMLRFLAIICLFAGCFPQQAKSKQQVAADAPRAGAVSAIASMMARRAAHTATLLDNGEVLIAGGFVGNGGGLSSTELFNPAINAFRSSRNMGASRVSHTATRLRDGKVLIAGGYDGDYLSSAELYDPTTNRFRSVAPMTLARSGHSATLLSDGKVLLTGSTGKSWTFLPDAELFDPQTNSFTRTGVMRVARESHTANLLSDGRVLVAGGHAGRRPSVTIYASAEIYDPTTGTFSAAGDMTRIRHKHESTLLRDGRVLITGGSDERDGRGAYVTAEIYDPRSGDFAAAGDMQLARYKHQGTSALLSDGKVLIAGGADRAEIFDPVRNAFSYAAGDLGTNRYFATATRLRDGRVLILGGYDDSNAASGRAWVFQRP